MQTLTRTNAAQSRARRLSQRFNAHAMPIPTRLTAQTSLAIESLAIDEAAREIGVNSETMRLQNEISCLRVRLLTARGVEALDVADRLGAACEDLALAKFEAMQ